MPTLALPMPETHVGYIFSLNQECLLVTESEDLRTVRISSVKRSGTDNDTVYLYTFVHLDCDMQDETGEATSAQKNLLPRDGWYCPLVVGEKAFLVDKSRNEVEHVIITSWEFEGYGIDSKHVYNYKKLVSGETGVATKADNSLYHLSWTGIYPCRNHLHVPFQTGDLAMHFNERSGKFMHVQIGKVVGGDAINKYWRKYWFKEVGDTDPESSSMTTRCDDFDLFHMYEELPAVLPDEPNSFKRSRQLR